MEEHIVVGEGTRYPLQGILALPGHPSAGKAWPVPAVVMVQGSGPSDRDESVGPNKPFYDIAEGLATYGIASVRYDKRTFTYGKQMVRELAGELTINDEMIEDAHRAKNLLREDERIDSHRIFLLGHSLGGMMAPRIDATGGNFAGLIIMAGTPVSLREVLLRQSEETLSQANILLRPLIKREVTRLKRQFSEMQKLTESQAKKLRLAGRTYAWYFKDMETPSNVEYLSKVDKPILFMQGGRDFQVKDDIDFAEYRRICGEMLHATFKLYPDLNHLFMPSKGSTIKEFKKDYRMPSSVDPAVIADIAAWIHATIQPSV